MTALFSRLSEPWSEEFRAAVVFIAGIAFAALIFGGGTVL